VNTPSIVWQPDPARAAASQLARFQQFVEARHGLRFSTWAEFHRDSVVSFRRFWSDFLEWSAVRRAGSAEPVCDGDTIERARFFPALRLSYTGTVLDGGGQPDAAVAIVECHEAETPTAALQVREVTRGELRRDVARIAQALEAQGIGPGDRVVALAAHDADTIAVALAATGLGATWSSCGPELANEAVLARFGPLEPAAFVVTGQYRSGGVRHDLLARAREVAAALPTLRLTLVTGAAADAAVTRDAAQWPHHLVALAQLMAGTEAVTRDWTLLPFNQPLFLLFSSGTTGAPKAIVHGAGGTLLEHLKEHRLHGDLGPGDRLYYQTTCGWMMWHWTLSGLATGAAIVTYDGSVATPDASALWRLAARTGVTVLGASPAFWQYTRDSAVSPRTLGTTQLRALASTGSMLDDHWYDWARREVGEIPLMSISGGTDIIGCFVLGNPTLPVYRGESQCVSLALDVRALADPAGGPDELVCGTPFPSRPLGLLHDHDGSRFHEAYFAAHPGLWTHGDFIELTARGTARILGRADAVLKVKGVRIGPAEITGIARRLPEVRDAMAVEQRHADSPGGSRIVLLVVLQDGVALDRALVHRIKRAIRDGASADHVPAVVAAIPELPTTLNGKLSERAAREALAGQVPVNRAAIRNPEVLDLIRALPEASRDHPA